MSTATIYATAAHKQKDGYGCYGYAIWKKNGKKPTEKVGTFPSTSKTKTQLTTLIESLATMEKIKDLEEVKLITDFSLVKYFLNGTIIDWERADWVKENGKPVPHAELYQELAALSVEYNIQFITPKEGDDKMATITKKMKSESRKQKNPSGKKVKSPKIREEDTDSNNQPLENQVEISEVFTPPTAKIQGNVSEKTREKDFIPAPPSAEKVAKILQEDRGGNIKVDPKLKQDFEDMFGKIGMPVQVAVALFLAQSIRKKEIDLDLKSFD